MSCEDFLGFQESLRKMRDLDDKIIYALNANVPTPTFQSQIDQTTSCRELYEQLKVNYDKREAAIKECISLSSSKVKDLKVKRDSSDDPSIRKQLSKEQTKLRLLQSELNVEEVVKDRSIKLFYERCRQYYKPADVSFQ